jgi:predicted metal-binding membrane protein
LSRDRLVLGAGVCALTGLGWGYLVYDARNLHCARMMGPAAHDWTGAEFGMVFAMWAIMMVAMMVPSAAPMLLAFDKVQRARRARGAAYVATSVFLAGYLIVWTAFSAAATLVQWDLQRRELLASTMESASPILTGALLILAGVFQWTPLKQRCLTHCHTPFQFITAHWREGSRGALDMGLRHGVYCVGCCWAVMALLFVAGVMNLWWIAVLSVYVLLEKIAPKALSRPVAPVMVAAGIWFMV